MSVSTNTIICFGEVLWDVLPTGKLAGGAPMNVAYHLNNFGWQTQVISRIGWDDLGRELLGFLQQKGVGTDMLQIDGLLPTGTVAVSLDKNGSPAYEIVAPVAWDNIQMTAKQAEVISQSAAFVYGSLSTRQPQTYRSLQQLLPLATLRVLDINLRAPFYNQNRITALLQSADIVKLNDEELDLLTDWYKLSTTMNAAMEQIAERFKLQQLIVTRGADGAIALTEEGFTEQTGFPITVKDTIGSGDSFLAAYLYTYLKGKSSTESLEFAAATGAYVATCAGANPSMTSTTIQDFIKRQRAVTK